MKTYYLDKFLVTNFSVSSRKRFQSNIKRIGFTEIGFFVEVSVWVDKVKMEGILSVGYPSKKSIKDIVELQELIPDVDMALSCNEEFEENCRKVAEEFNRINKIDFPGNEVDCDEF